MKKLFGAWGFVAKAAAGATVLATLGAASVVQAGERPPNWTGFYLGGHLGYGWQKDDNRLRDLDGYNGAGNFTYSAEGGFGGAQAGFNLQLQKVVVGIEGEFGLGFAGQAQFPAFVGARTSADSVASVDFDRYATVTGRLGVLATDRLLIYGKAGWGWVHANASFTDTDPIGITLTSGTSRSANLDGAVWGGGIEYALNSMLYIAVILLVIILGYKIFAYNTIWGKKSTLTANDVRENKNTFY